VWLPFVGDLVAVDAASFSRSPPAIMTTTTFPRFLLVGNGPYANRGCEAIVRGTMEILRREFGPDIRATVASFQHKSLVDRQAAGETDPAITHVALERSLDRWSGRWWHYQMLRCSNPFADLQHCMLGSHLPNACAVLQVGGDNYTLDYGTPSEKGLPSRWMALDRYVWRAGLPAVLWGASVGPFDAVAPQQQRAMFQHLTRLRAILVRETTSQRYLTRNAVPNVHLVADPAFVMKPRQPADDSLGFALPEAPIGLNFSPLMARYVTGGDRARWIQLCAQIVEGVLKLTRRSILLIPHVTSNAPSADDAVLLAAVAERSAGGDGQVHCVPGTLAAAEYKWLISQCHAFAGARTHATIAAFSTGVPTLSLAYSAKARGLNQDIFGSQDYCMGASELAAPENVVSRLKQVLADADTIRTRLRQVLPGVLDRAYSAGPLLRRLIGAPALAEAA
jgi:polysaccharide pyruvyl transferase WcaK-like protein